MKTVNARNVWTLSLLALALAAPGMAAVELTAPVSGTAVALVPEAQKRVMSQPTLADRQKLLAGDKALRGDKLWRKACPLVLKWRGTLGELGPWKVEIGKSPDLSDARVWYFKATKQDASAGAKESVISQAVPMANLEVAREYYWRVTSRGRCGFSCSPRHGCKESKSVVRSEIASFRTEDVAPRWIEVEGRVGNFRDFGGRRTADGRRVRQGMAYRGQGLNDNSVTGEEPGRNRLTTEDVKYLVGTLGIRTDLDLRGIGETVGMKESPLGAGITFIHHSSQCYKGIFGDEGKKVMAQNFRVFCDRRNYPIYFHCIGGADRTGSLACILNGLLGVDADLLHRDWQYTWAGRKKPQQAPEKLWNNLMKGLSTFEGATLNEKIEKYVLSCGFTADDIAKFRKLMLE